MTKSLEVGELGYTLFSDSEMTAARAFGIAYQLKPDMIDAYKGYGIDLAAAAGRDHHQLPVPSVFLVEKGGTVRWVYSNPDYKVRPANEQLMRAARAIAAHQAD